ncbi:hypothetical protein TREMEDRAFT_27287, partial [Tremella mesenterica DSM 1558]
LEKLSLLLSILKYITSVSIAPSPDPDVVHIAHQRLLPAFQPQGILASLLLDGLESVWKATPLRFADVLTAAAKLSSILPSPSSSSSSSQNFFLALFDFLIRRGMKTKADLIAVGCMFDHMPRGAIPSTLMDNLLEDLNLLTCGMQRSVLIVKCLALKPNPDLSILVPCLTSSIDPASTASPISRHFLPTLFKAFPSAPATLLRLLSINKMNTKGHPFPAWVAVASTGMTTGHLSISDIPNEELQIAIQHPEYSIRLKAFEIITNTKDLLAPHVVDLIKEAFICNSVLSDTGARTDFISACRNLFLNLETAEASAHASLRRATEGIKINHKRAQHMSPVDPNLALSQAAGIHSWLLESFIASVLKGCRRYPAVRTILGLSIFGLYVDTFGWVEKGPTRFHVNDVAQKRIYSEDVVQSLLSCQSSEYSDIRNRARAIIEKATNILPGLDDLESPEVQKLLQNAIGNLSHPRSTQAEAGRSVLVIIFRRLVYNPELRVRSDPGRFLSDLIQSLTLSISLAEQDLVREMEERPFHGLLLALSDLISCLDLEKPEEQGYWSPMFHDLFLLIQRIWWVTRKVISLNQVAGAEHEIARAYEVLGEDDDGEGGEETLDHTSLVSGCWRATRNAGILLSTIFTTGLPCSAYTEGIWSRKDVDQAGRMFTMWLREIRHRGTFSRIASSFALLVNVFKWCPQLVGLEEEWLEDEFTLITLDELSITRRSAAIPYSFLALIGGNVVLLDKAIDRLIDLAQVEHDSSDKTKVHAFNIMKVVLLDAKQTKYLDRYFERAVIVALRGFESSDWNVRNAGLILLSSLIHRTLTPPRGSADYFELQSTLASRQTFSSWHTRYPTLLPFLAEHIRKYSTPVRMSDKHFPLFPILIIVRSLRWSDSSLEMQKELTKAIWPLIGSQEWQIRHITAQALSSLLSPSRAMEVVEELRITLDSSEQISMNMQHGRLCLLQRLFRDVVDWNIITAGVRVGLETTFGRLLDHYGDGAHPLILKEIIECLNHLPISTTSESTELEAQAIQVARTALMSSSTVPGYDLLLNSCVTFLRMRRPTTLPTLINTGHPAVLTALSEMDCGSSSKTLTGLVRIALSSNVDNFVRVRVLDLVSGTKWTDEALRGVTKAEWYGVTDRIVRMVGHICVPLREAALPALAWSIGLRKTDSPISPAQLESVAQQILLFSNESQSEPTRSSSKKAMVHFAPFLFSTEGNPLPSNVRQKLHQALLRLLQDDDEDIRLASGGIVTFALGKSPVVHCKAVSMYWDQLESTLLSVWDEGWERWLLELWTDESGYRNDMDTLGDTNLRALFEEEPPNLFRDPLVDCMRAGKLLSLNITKLSETGRQKLKEVKRMHLEAKDKIMGLSKMSPIEEKWQARGDTLKRISLQEELFDAT